jgi:hypothetical protein
VKYITSFAGVPSIDLDKLCAEVAVMVMKIITIYVFGVH